MKTDQEKMENAFTNIVHNSIGYAKRMHKTVTEAAVDASRECALWVAENVHRLDLEMVKRMIGSVINGYPADYAVTTANSTEAQLANSIGTRQWRFVEHWSVNSEDEREIEENDSLPLANLEEANVVTSENRYYAKARELDQEYIPATQLPVLDLDCRHVYVPSTTPGHGHLLLDVALTQDDFTELLNVLAKCGILDWGYVKASLKRGYSAVRLPWIRKEVSIAYSWADILENEEEEKEELRDGFGNLITTR